MAQMPVATLRIWEQRYRAVQPATAASGHRLYSSADVQRVLLLRQLTGQGHAIGSIAGLSSSQLARLNALADGAALTSLGDADEPARAGQAPLDDPAAADRAEADDPSDRRTRGPHRTRGPLRLVVVGPALALRLQRPEVTRRLIGSTRVVAVFESLADAAQAGPALRADLLLWHATELQTGPSGEGSATLKGRLDAAREACRARQVAVVYRYAGADAARALAATGAALVREPADDASLATWLATTETQLSARVADRGPGAARTGEPGGRASGLTPGPDDRLPASESVPWSAAVASDAVAPRRFDDAALTAIAGLTPHLACECPRHVAELLMQIASFETYSAGCAHRSPEDAALHHYLHQVAATSRALFEAALERVARHEGLALAGLR